MLFYGGGLEIYLVSVIKVDIYEKVNQVTSEVKKLKKTGF